MRLAVEYLYRNSGRKVEWLAERAHDGGPDPSTATGGLTVCRNRQLMLNTSPKPSLHDLP